MTPLEIKSFRLSHLRNLLTIGYYDDNNIPEKQSLLLSIAKQYGASQDEINLVFNADVDVQFYIPKPFFLKINTLFDLIKMVYLGDVNQRAIETVKAISSGYDIEEKIMESLLKRLIENFLAEKNENIIEQVLDELNYPTKKIKNEILDPKIILNSSKHIKFSDSKQSSKEFFANRQIVIEYNKDLDVGYIVTVLNLDENHPLWSNNIQVAPKQMQIIESTESIIHLIGFGQDGNGEYFADYGLTINLDSSQQIDNIILHVKSRDINIKYLK